MKINKVKKQWWMFFLSFGTFSVIWFFLFYLSNRQINNAKEAIYFGTPISAYWVFYISALIYGLTTWGFFVFIKEGIRKKSFQEFRVHARGVLRLAIVPILISLPFLYLGITNAIVITEEKITLSPFWSFTSQDYFWDNGIAGVEIDYSLPYESDTYQRSFNGKYIIHFKDGKTIDLWANTLEGEITAIKEIDSHIQKKNITFFVRHAPSNEIIEEYFSENADFIYDLYSR